MFLAHLLSFYLDFLDQGFGISLLCFKILRILKPSGVSNIFIVFSLDLILYFISPVMNGLLFLHRIFFSTISFSPSSDEGSWMFLIPEMLPDLMAYSIFKISSTCNYFSPHFLSTTFPQSLSLGVFFF